MKQAMDLFAKCKFTDVQLDAIRQLYFNHVHEWHSVRNTAPHERIAFGWNFSIQQKKSYEECRDIMISLGYIDE